MVELLMRIFSLAFHLLLSLAMLAIGFVAWAGGHQTLQIGFLPWTGAALIYCLLLCGLGGLIITLLAARRTVRLLFVLWSLAVVVMLARGYIFSSYNFGLTGVSTALYFMAASLLALIGSARLAWPRHSGARRRSVLV
jgi:hypothetical protein